MDLATSAGAILAREVLVATNGYTGAGGAGAAAPRGAGGELSDRDRAARSGARARLRSPALRVLSDTKNLLYYFRLSPDGRMVFGGRAAFTPTPVARSAAILARGHGRSISRAGRGAGRICLGGQVAFTVDQMPHAGRLDGVHYALGYGGHGVAMATWLGARMGDALAGAGEIPRLTAHVPGGPAVRRHAVVPAARGRVL